MRTSTLLTCLFTPNAFALEKLVERAACQFYAATQVTACPTGTEFCSSFLRTQPPIITKTTVIRQTVTSRSTTTVTTTTTDPSRTTNIACNTQKRALEARQAAFGPSCNVKQIEPSRIEQGCSCMKGFTYTGKRPRPATITQKRTTTISRISTISATATQTLDPDLRFAIKITDSTKDDAPIGFAAAYLTTHGYGITNSTEPNTNFVFTTDGGFLYVQGTDGKYVLLQPNGLDFGQVYGGNTVDPNYIDSALQGIIDGDGDCGSPIIPFVGNGGAGAIAKAYFCPGGIDGNTPSFFAQQDSNDDPPSQSSCTSIGLVATTAYTPLPTF